MDAANGTDRVGALAKALKDGGVLKTPERLGAVEARLKTIDDGTAEQADKIATLEEEVRSLRKALDEQLTKANAKQAKALRKVAEALASKVSRHYRVRKELDGSWDVEVGSE